MEAMREHEEHPDDALVALVANGDEAAFAVLYDRYFNSVYDLAVRTLRDPALAADATEVTFAGAWTRLAKGRSGPNFKAWLHTAARDATIGQVRRMKRSTSAAAPLVTGSTVYAQPAASQLADEQSVVEDAEIAQIVWMSAAAFRPKQYTVLDLHLRRGLTVDDLAASLYQTKSHVYTMLRRLREALSESVTYTLLLRRGRRECRELDALLSEKGVLDNAKRLRRTLREHLKQCLRCQANRRRYASPLEVFGTLAVVPPAPGVKDAVWHSISARINNGAPAREHSTAAAPLQAIPPKFPLRIAGAGGAVIVLVAGLVAGALVLASGGGSSGGAEISDPDDIRATDREPGTPSTDNRIDVEWTAVPGVEGYSVLWGEKSDDLPDTERDLPGTATGTKSPPLEPGSWYFHLRTQGSNGRWTSTVHLGPFEIIPGGSDVSPTATAAASPSPSTSTTPVVTPNFVTPGPTAQPDTPTPSPNPTPTPTPAATPTPQPASPTPSEEPSPAPTP
ncbi:MAG TPA: sigma-70 family RNA polymerase sigma factor [Dehalococcoidia bacterium]|jgi:RNA polymerase sigma factor (sigma-70 family)|nr:sigma-70 family RNA polymerase sigma factor [Dehalococcoidia bacterium]